MISCWPPPRLAFAAPAGQRFVPVQPELFDAAGAQPNCWGDFDNDGDLDSVRRASKPICRIACIATRTRASSSKSAPHPKVADLTDTGAPSRLGRSKRRRQSRTLRRIYAPLHDAQQTVHRHDGAKFVDVAHELGVDVMGETRQVAWIDFDNDGKVDLFVAFRDAPNMLFHNEGNRFVNVAPDMGVDDPRKTVGAVWFDYNEDGRLDLFVANQDGTLNGLFRNDGKRFVDVAHELGMDAFGRITNSGSNGPSVVDYNNDGRMDLFVSCQLYLNFLFRNDGGGKFNQCRQSTGRRKRRTCHPVRVGRFR